MVVMEMEEGEVFGCLVLLNGWHARRLLWRWKKVVIHCCEEERREGGGDGFVVVRLERIMKVGRRIKFCVLLNKSLLSPQNPSYLVKANEKFIGPFGPLLH